MDSKTYRIATYPGLKGEPVLLRENDGSLIIMEGEPDSEDARRVLAVPRFVPLRRTAPYNTPDAEQEAFAARVVALLNGGK